MIGASRSQNTSDTSSVKGCKKDGTNKTVHDEMDDAIALHHKSMFLVQYHIGQEEGRTTMVESPALKNIGASCSHNTSNKPSRKDYKKDGANKTVHDEGDDDIASNRRSMFLVQSHLVQE